ncbi:hypothetical protein CHUAL_011285 [Chamberlinius hualienensis]
MPETKKSTATNHGNCNRRSNKPLMEKRRRARINHSLTELKNLIMDTCVKKEQPTSRSSKLEKADILELTVKHVQHLHEQQQTKKTSENDVKMDLKSCEIMEFKDGYRKCQREVASFMESTDGFDIELRRRLDTYLINRFTQLTKQEVEETDVNKAEVDKCDKMTSNFQLIPTRLLPTGEIAFMLPLKKQDELINQLWKQNGIQSNVKYNNNDNGIGIGHQVINGHESMWRPW